MLFQKSLNYKSQEESYFSLIVEKVPSILLYTWSSVWVLCSKSFRYHMTFYNELGIWNICFVILQLLQNWNTIRIFEKILVDLSFGNKKIKKCRRLNKYPTYQKFYQISNTKFEETTNISLWLFTLWSN